VSSLGRFGGPSAAPDGEVPSEPTDP
jgi:hypothetical protein